jgi:moderate conductance mechanosensitive channel
VSDLTQACGEDPTVACRNVYEWTGNEALAKVAQWLVDHPLKIGLILLTAWIATKVARRLIRRSVRKVGASASTGRLDKMSGGGLIAPERAGARTEAVANVLGSVAASAIWVVAVLVALGELDIDLGPLIAGAGVAGIALGFGAQQMVRDYLSGIYIIVEDQFGVGDSIDLQDVSGDVEEVTLRSTRVRDVDGVLWTVANGEILKVGNKTKGWSRSKLDVSVAYGTDLRQAMDLITSVAAGLREDLDWTEDVIDEPEMWGVQHLAADGVTIRVVLKVRPGRQFAVTRELQLRIAEAMDAAGIEIPFPQRRVWLRQAEDGGEEDGGEDGGEG